jgi:hypothetical protein
MRRSNTPGFLDAVYARSGNLFRQANIHHVARFAAVDQEQRTVSYKPAQRLAHGFLTEAKIPRQPDDREMKACLAFEVAVTKKVIIDGSFRGVEAQTRGKRVLELLADECGVGLFGFHDEIRDMEWSAKRRQRHNTENTVKEADS